MTAAMGAGPALAQRAAAPRQLDLGSPFGGDLLQQARELDTLLGRQLADDRCPELGEPTRFHSPPSSFW
jgi:hypothetical protein